MAIDVTKLQTTLPAQEEGIEVKLLNEEGEEAGASIRVAGPDSKRAKKAQAKLIEERGMLRIRKVSAERMEYERRYIAAAACISWDGFNAGGGDYECNLSNAMKLFEVKPEWLEQVEAVSNNRAVFSKA